MSSSQQNSQELKDNEIAASLAFATNLSQQLMPKAQPEATEGSQDAESAPQQGDQPETQETAPQEEQAPTMQDFETILSSKLDEMKKELKADSQKEIENIKQEIKAAINEEDTQTKT